MSDDARAGVWRGHLMRGPADDIITGELTDPWGYRLIIIGKRDTARGLYVLEAHGEGTGVYRIPAIDGEGP